MNANMKDWIDKASYESLLSKWRNAPIGSPWFQGEIGIYYEKVMQTKRDADPDGHVTASKSIGWAKS